MYINVTEQMFHNEFHTMGRESNFSYQGRSILFDYLEELENYELDVIAICCEFSESTWQEVADNYNIDLSEYGDADDRIEAIKEYLEHNTIVVGYTDDFVVYADF